MSQSAVSREHSTGHVHPVPHTPASVYAQDGLAAAHALSAHHRRMALNLLATATGQVYDVVRGLVWV